jgi:hypothetical protein
MQAERVRDAVRDDAAMMPGHRMLRYRLRPVAVKQGRVVVPDGPEEDTGLTAHEALGYDSRVLQGLPAQLQHEPLLRIHDVGLSGRDAEEHGVEAVDSIEEPTPAGVQPLAGRSDVGSDERVRIPALPRHLGDRVPPVPEQLPEAVWGRRVREPTRHSDDRDGLVLLPWALSRGDIRALGLLAGQVVRQGGGGMVLPHEKGRQGTPERRREVRDQAHRVQRFEAVAAEPLAGIYRLRRSAKPSSEEGCDQATQFVLGLRRHLGMTMPVRHERCAQRFLADCGGFCRTRVSRNAHGGSL